MAHLSIEHGWGVAAKGRIPVRSGGAGVQRLAVNIFYNQIAIVEHILGNLLQGRAAPRTPCTSRWHHVKTPSKLRQHHTQILCCLHML